MPERAKYVLRIASAVISLVALALIVKLGWSQLRDAASLHRHWDVLWILVAVFAQCLVYISIAGMFKISLSADPKTPSPIFLIYSAFAFLFANRSLPGPAVAGVATLVYLFRKKKVPAVDAQAAAGSFYFADYAGFFTLIAAVFVPLLVDQPNHSVRLAYIIGLSIIAAAAIVAIMIFLYPSPLVSFFGKVIDLSTSKTRTGANLSGEVERFVLSLHGKIMSATKSPLKLAAYYLLSILMHCAEVATVLCGAKAAGIPLSIPAAAVSYVGGNLASIISVLPGAIGFYEAGMIGTMHVAGHISLGDATVCAMTYRLLSFWAPLPVVANVLLKASKEGFLGSRRSMPTELAPRTGRHRS